MVIFSFFFFDPRLTGRFAGEGGETIEMLNYRMMLYSNPPLKVGASGASLVLRYTTALADKAYCDVCVPCGVVLRWYRGAKF